jgi:hypothetical protein
MLVRQSPRYSTWLLGRRHRHPGNRAGDWGYDPRDEAEDRRLLADSRQAPGLCKQAMLRASIRATYTRAGD